MDDLYIIIVDDDPEDVDVLRSAFLSTGNTTPIKEYYRGNELLKDVDNGISLPCLFVVDLNMPELSGIELIPLLKANPSVRHIPIIVFSTGVTPQERLVLDKLGIESFKKPDSLREWEKIAEVMNGFCKEEYT